MVCRRDTFEERPPVGLDRRPEDRTQSSFELIGVRSPALD
jgi:hypothetical protein